MSSIKKHLDRIANANCTDIELEIYRTNNDRHVTGGDEFLAMFAIETAVGRFRQEMEKLTDEALEVFKRTKNTDED